MDGENTHVPFVVVWVVVPEMVGAAVQTGADLMNFPLGQPASVSSL